MHDAGITDDDLAAIERKCLWIDKHENTADDPNHTNDLVFALVRELKTARVMCAKLSELYAEAERKKRAD